MGEGKPDFPHPYRTLIAMHPHLKRILLILFVIFAGLGSRRSSPYIPDFCQTYAGDVLYATLIYLLLGFVSPTSLWKRGVLALAWCWGVEFLQAWHVPWLDGVRATGLGALVLGRGFVASDLVCYVFGVALGMGFEFILALRRGSSTGSGCSSK